MGIFFGSDDGNTERVAALIQQRLQDLLKPHISMVDLHDVANVTQLDFDNYEFIILGIPTWDFGQIQSDWEEFWDDIGAVDFTGKTVALFGLGDQFGYGDYFLDAMGMLHDVVAANGAKIIGHWSVKGYEYDASKAEINHPVTQERCFVGLAIDEDQQEELTESRVSEWCSQLSATIYAR
ncbi:MAG: flavodoxin I [Candidatus Endobugula sp.]|jgi:flavodoxin I